MDDETKIEFEKLNKELAAIKKKVDDLESNLDTHQHSKSSGSTTWDY